jgi:hypothetical protein
MKKQSQITYGSGGFFSSGLEPERTSSQVPEAPKLNAPDVSDHDAVADLRVADRAKQTHLMPIFAGFFAAGLPPEPSSSQGRVSRPDDRQKSVGSFTWQILE